MCSLAYSQSRPLFYVVLFLCFYVSCLLAVLKLSVSVQVIDRKTRLRNDLYVLMGTLKPTHSLTPLAYSVSLIHLLCGLPASVIPASDLADGLQCNSQTQGRVCPGFSIGGQDRTAENRGRMPRAGWGSKPLPPARGFWERCEHPRGFGAEPRTPKGLQLFSPDTFVDYHVAIDGKTPCPLMYVPAQNVHIKLA